LTTGLQHTCTQPTFGYPQGKSFDCLACIAAALPSVTEDVQQTLLTAIFIMERLVQHASPCDAREQAYAFLKEHPVPGSYAETVQKQVTGAPSQSANDHILLQLRKLQRTVDWLVKEETQTRGLGKLDRYLEGGQQRRAIGLCVLTRVQTSLDWTEEAQLKRRWGAPGRVTGIGSGHGVVYRVDHLDGDAAWYNPDELEEISEARYAFLGGEE